MVLNLANDVFMRKKNGLKIPQKMTLKIQDPRPITLKIQKPSKTGHPLKLTNKGSQLQNKCIILKDLWIRKKPNPYSWLYGSGGYLPR